MTMSPEERDRLAKLEQVVADMKDDLAEIKKSTARLESYAHRGQGALGVFLKLGGLVAVLVAAAWALFERFHK